LQELRIDEEQAKQQCALLEQTWDILNEVTADLKNQGVKVPSEIDASLRSSKSLINLCKSHTRLSDLPPRVIDTYLGFCVGCCGQDVVTRIKCELRNVEDRLIIQAMNEVGKDLALRLQQRTVKAWEPLKERIIHGIGNLSQAVKVESDVFSGYQRIVEENISYWLAAEEDMVDSYKRMLQQTSDEKTKSTLAEIIEDSRKHIEALESIRESFRKILADAQRHVGMLQELSQE
jgi:bacterioferritin (cytochrome b1)